MVSPKGGDTMNKETKKLIEEFQKITKKSWIKSVNKGFGSIGLTFEQELEKSPDSMYFPDYYGTEIKCTSRFSRYPIGLFTVAFDGPTFPEINRIIDKYGYSDRFYPDRKAIFKRLYFQQQATINNKWKFKLELDKLEEKIYLCVYTLDDKLMERKSFVYLKSIYDHLMPKLNKLAIVNASSKLFDDEKYFRYYKISIFSIISFKKFLELLTTDDIEVNLVARIQKSGKDKGVYKDKNLVFKMKKDKITKLFNLIYSYDSDTGKEIMTKH